MCPGIFTSDSGGMEVNMYSNDNDDNYSEIRQLIKKPVLIVSLIVYLLFLIITKLYFYSEKQSDLWTAMGNVGDIFAPIIALLTLVVMMTEVDNTNKLNKETNYRIKKREIKDDIFRLIEIHHIIVNRMRKSKVDENESGLQYFRKRYKEFKKQLKSNMDLSLNEKKESELYEYLEEQFIKFFNDNHNQLGQYFRYVYNVIREIDESELRDDDKKRLASLYIAQLSGWEYLFLFFNCICNLNNSYKFAKLAIKYNVFQHMFTDMLKKCDEAMGRNGELEKWGESTINGSYPEFIQKKLTSIDKEHRNGK